MKTVVICNLKGGVAKTTTCVNLAALLAREFSKRVLVIDADSQCNTTAFYLRAAEGVGPHGDGAARRDTLADLLRMPKVERTRFSVSFNLDAAIGPSSFDGVDLLPGDSTLMDLDLSKVESEEVFSEVLALGLPDLQSRYDFVLIDCPPAFNAASAAALLAADEVLIPIKLDAFALDGMANLMQQIVNMRRINPRLKVLGLLPVMWYRSDQIVKAESTLRNAGLPVLPRIRRSNRVDDMTFAQEPLCVCAPRCGAAQDYRRLAAWITREAETGGRQVAAPAESRTDGEEAARRG